MYLYIMTLKSDLEARSYQLKSVAVVFFFFASACFGASDYS